MDKLKVTVIQSDLHWEDRSANLQMFEEKIGTVRESMELVLLPEMFSTGFSMHPAALAEPMDGASVKWMRRVSAEHRIILAGSLIIEERGEYYNRLIWMLPNGELGYYDKRHLFAYAGENKQYSPGSGRLIASVKGWKINLLVCYDLRFPVWSRQTVPVPFPAMQATPDPDKDDIGDPNAKPAPAGYPGPEYDVLVYVANWPQSRIHAWKTLLQARAIENQCYVVGVNRVGKDGNGICYNGDSMIVGPMGEIIKTVTDQETIFTSTLQAEPLQAAREKFPFLKDADPFFIGR